MKFKEGVAYIVTKDTIGTFIKDVEQTDIIMYDDIKEVKKMLERDNLEDFKIARSALARVGMESFEKRMFSTLSGGEQQLVLAVRDAHARDRIVVDTVFGERVAVDGDLDKLHLAVAARARAAEAVGFEQLETAQEQRQ